MKTEIGYSTLFSKWRAGLTVKDKPNEYESKDLMQRAGLPVPLQHLIQGADLSNLPENMKEPLVVKLCSPDVLHKTDVDGVYLDVKKHELPSLIKEMNIKFPGEDFLVYHMESIKGPEFIMGALKDPSFGPAVMVGAGGIMTELYKDVSFCLAPCELHDADHMLTDLTIAPVLDGFRGSKMDMESLKILVVRFSELAAVTAVEGVQLDINPIVWNGKAWTILDAKCVFP